MIDMSRPQH